MTEPHLLNREKLIKYLLDEIEHPRCVSSNCVCLNLKQKVEYGDFDKPTTSAEKVLDGLELELHARKSLIESSAMGQPLSDYQRGEIMGLYHTEKKIEELRQQGERG